MDRPVVIDEVFNLGLDVYTTMFGGLIAPKLCESALSDSLKDFPALVALDSSFSNDIFIDKNNYLSIAKTEKRAQDVTNATLSMIIVFTYESLKSSSHFEKVKDKEEVKFLRHLRNAAAHGNKFHFYNGTRLADPGIVSWRTKTIDISIQGQTAFPNFFKHGDLGFLLEDISSIVKES